MRLSSPNIVAVEHPAQLRVLMHVALYEQRVLLRVEAAGDILRKLLGRVAAQDAGSCRTVMECISTMQ